MTRAREPSKSPADPTESVPPPDPRVNKRTTAKHRTSRSQTPTETAAVAIKPSDVAPAEPPPAASEPAPRTGPAAIPAPTWPEAPSFGTSHDALAGVGLMAGELVHALRNPVAALTTSIELLAAGGLDAEMMAQLQRAMRNQVSKMDQLLARCRELSKLGSLALVRTDVCELARARLRAREDELGAKGVELTARIADAPAWVTADAQQLGDVLDSLLNNALDSMPSGGSLEVTVTVDPGADPARPVVIAVRDTGGGIAATSLRNVFRLFYTTRPNASGVGLTIAQHVIAAHGGSIEVRSIEGRGTLATLRLRPA